MHGLCSCEHMHASRHSPTCSHCICPSPSPTPPTTPGTDLQLFDWLDTYTFPTEASFSDPTHARAIYLRVVARLLRLGTTTAAFFTTLHAQACEVLADVVAQLGQRALVGKVRAALRFCLSGVQQLPHKHAQHSQLARAQAHG